MKNLFKNLAVLTFLVTALLLSSSSAFAQSSASGDRARIAIVSSKKCLEESKLGKQEQANFERMKNQMEAVLQEKEKALEDLENKTEDEDYMDSISDEAAAELKRKKRNLRQEGYQLQSQYMQTLQQANIRIIQRIADAISKASEQVALDASHTNQPIDLIVNDEAVTYFSPSLDVSDKVIAKMNVAFDAEQSSQNKK